MKTRAPNPHRRRVRRGRLLAAAGLALAAAGAAAVRAFEFGVPGEWTWRWNAHPLWDRAWLPACFFAMLLAALLAGQAYARRMRMRDEAALLALVAALVFACVLSTTYLGKGAAQDVVFAALTPWVSGYFDAARRDVVDAGEFLRRYPAYLRSLPMTGPMIHVGQHPPGDALFYWALLRALKASPGLTDAALRAGRALSFTSARALDQMRVRLTRPEEACVWLSFFLTAAGLAAGAAPVYLVVRCWRGRQAALLAVGLYAATPSLHLFAAHVDALLAPLAAAACALWAWALRRRSPALACLTGAALAAGLFVSLHFLAVAALCAAAAAAWARPRRWSDAARLCAWLLAGLAAATAAQYAGGYSPLEVWRICLSKHRTFYVHFPRTYWKWVWANLLEFVLFAGAASAVLWAAVSATTLRRAAAGRARLPDAALAAAGMAALLALNFSGQNLSETARLWMFLMPLAAGAGGAALAAWAPGSYWPWLVVAAQIVQTLVFKLRLDVFSIYG